VSTKDICQAVLAFATPFVLWFGLVMLMTVPKTGAVRGDSIVTALAPGLMIIAPFLGFSFIARSFRRWQGRDRSSKRLIIGMSCLYWLLYIPVLYAVWAVYAVGRAGGI